jgi:N-acetylglucosamine malate deacetylase 1
MNPYHPFVDQYTRLYTEGRELPLGGIPPAPRPSLPADAPSVLIFAPHPDDECIIGGLPLRLLREAGLRVINVAVTQGSNKERQAGRFDELKQACDFLGFDLLQTAPGGLNGVNPRTREQDPATWQRSVGIIAAILEQTQLRAIFFPHDLDWNSTHVGTHLLIVDALQSLDQFECLTIETEFWGQMATPNLMVESSAADLVDLVAATSFHVGEVRRNPYHLRLPAWMQDNVRRGGELVGGQGQAAPDFIFATLYRLRQWSSGAFHPLYKGGRHLSAGDNLTEFLAGLAPSP